MKIGFYSLGCKVNQYESDAMAQNAKKHGYSVSDTDDADIIVVNSCTVTSTADSKSRQAVRKFKRLGKTVVLTGCMPQAYPQQASLLAEADIVLGNKNNHKLFDAVDTFFETKNRVFMVEEHKKGDPFISECIASCEGRTRAVVKIQDGCDRFCAYCVIPYARGRVRSKPLDDIKKELLLLADSGYREVVFAGINLSSYGRDINLDLSDAVKAANDTPGIQRVRLGSLEPDHMTDEMIKKLSVCQKLCPQFHISLQSGCDKTLKAMNRHYDSAEYERICRSLRSSFKDCTITTDFMVGFPGETDEDFAQSLGFIRKIGFQKVHVFPYSPREGTRAAKMPGQLDKSVKQQRCRAAIDCCEEIRKSFFESNIGKQVSVLLESKSSCGYMTGYTENYIPVKVKAPHGMCGAVVECVIVSSDGERCTGELI